MDPPQTDEMLNRQRESLLVLMTLVRSPRVKKAASSAVLPRWSHDGFLNLLLPCVCCLQDRTYALKSPHRSTNHKKRFHFKLLLLIYAFNAFPPLCEWTNHIRFVLTTNLIYPANRDVQFQKIILTRLEESSLQVENLFVCVCCLSVCLSSFQDFEYRHLILSQDHVRFWRSEPTYYILSARGECQNDGHGH